MDQLIKRLRRGWLSSAQWFAEAGSLKLTSRISEVRRSHKVESKWIAKNGKRFMTYRIAAS